VVVVIHHLQRVKRGVLIQIADAIVMVFKLLGKFHILLVNHKV